MQHTQVHLRIYVPGTKVAGSSGKFGNIDSQTDYSDQQNEQLSRRAS